METTVKLYSLNYTDAKTYWTATLFVAGNVLLPALLHLIPQGGMMWLPIYFFTLIGAYKYGWQVGLLTALFSPVVNSLLVGMPLPVALPAIMSKSVLLAVAASCAAHYFGRISILVLMGVVLSYQCVGTLLEWAYVGNLQAALQDFRIGIPGMCLQVVGGYLFIRYLMRK